MVHTLLPQLTPLTDFKFSSLDLNDRKKLSTTLAGWRSSTRRRMTKVICIFGTPVTHLTLYKVPEVFQRIQVWASTGPNQDFQLLALKAGHATFSRMRSSSVH
eukprot:PhF_6_TR40792/c2_g3_i1/m.61609